MRKISVSIFDRVSNGGALREFCYFRRGIGRKNLRENAGKKAVGTAYPSGYIPSLFNQAVGRSFQASVN